MDLNGSQKPSIILLLQEKTTLSYLCCKRSSKTLKMILIAGLLVVIPLATTIWLTFTIANWVIRVSDTLSEAAHPL